MQCSLDGDVVRTVPQSWRAMCPPLGGIGTLLDVDHLCIGRIDGQFDCTGVAIGMPLQHGILLALRGTQEPRNTWSTGKVNEVNGL